MAGVTDKASKRTKKILLECDCGCGTTFLRYKNKVYSRNYLNNQHRAAAVQKELTEAQCGPYLGLFREYMEGTAKSLYGDLVSVRKALRPFFLFLQLHDILSLDDVTSDTITAFKSWGIESGYKRAADDTSALSVFFQWAIIEGRYSGESPVIARLHAKRQKLREGRPYSTEEMLYIREILEERGNPRLRAFFEIAAESGMRASEICRLRLQNLVLHDRKLFVALPNKTRTERDAFFYTRTSSRVVEWLNVRIEDCGHDFLFHNHLGNPLKYHSISRELNQTLRLGFAGRVCNETGLEKFGLHRLRHTVSSTLASNGASASTLMQTLGWVSQSSIESYTKIDEDSKRRGFAHAMNKIEGHCGSEHKEVLSLEEFLLSIDE